MADAPMLTVPVNLPADLVAQMEDLKKHRERDRERTVEEIVQEMCRSYVRVLEKVRWELEHREEIARSYREHPSDWDDAEVWEEEFRRSSEGPRQ